MSRPGSASSLHKDVAIRPSAQRSKSYEKSTSYRLFPTIEPTPPATPVALQRQLSTGSPLRSRSASFDSTARKAAGQQDAVVKTGAVRRGRKVSDLQVKHMSTLQEMPSPTVSIAWSFLPRTSEDMGHARSSSAPGEFVRDSQTLPSARIDLSKPQWMSKQADGHPAKGLGLSLPASQSTSRLEQKRAAPTSRLRPNLTIEVKNGAKMKPKAIIVRDDEIDDDQPPPPPPPKSPRHDSRNQSLNGIQYDTRNASRTRSRTTSRTSTRSDSSPDSAHPSETTMASQGSFVKANLVESPSSPPMSKPKIQHVKSDSYSPLSGDVRIKELMMTAESEAQEDLERPVPPPITPGQPRVASLARVVSIPSLPKSVNVERPTTKSGPEASSDKGAVAQAMAKSTGTIIPAKQPEGSVPRAVESSPATEEIAKQKPVKQGSQDENASSGSPAFSLATSKSAKSKSSKLNLDKPMPSLPAPSSRFSEHMRQVRETEGLPDEEVPPVPPMQASTTPPEEAKSRNIDSLTTATVGKPPVALQPHTRTATPDPERPKLPQNELVEKQDASTHVQKPAQQTEAARKDVGKAPRGGGLSAFPSIPIPPQYYGRSAREGSPSRPPPTTRPPPPTNIRQQAPPGDASPRRQFPPGHPLNRPAYPPFMPQKQAAAKEQGPPRSRFYGRPSESANASQTSLVEPDVRPGSRQGPQVSEKLSSREGGNHTRIADSQSRPQPPVIQTTPVEIRSTPILDSDASVEKGSKPAQSHDEHTKKDGHSNTMPAQPKANDHLRDQHLLKRPESPANLWRSPSPTPSTRSNSAGDLLNKASGAKSLPSLPPEIGPRPMTPDALSVLTPDSNTTIVNPLQTLRDLTKQSEALHARHASLRADRLKLSTSISAGLKDSKPGPEYANSLLDQHLSLNAINSSLDICFAKLKSLDCKKEEAIQALVEQTKERHVPDRRHRNTSSVATHSTQGSISGHSSKSSTPDIGNGPLPTLRERDSHVPAKGVHATAAQAVEAHVRAGNEGHGHRARQQSDASTSSSQSSIDADHASITDGLPTPRPIHPPPPDAPAYSDSNATTREMSPMEAATASSPETKTKRNTMVKMPTITPAPFQATNQPPDASPVSPMDAHDNNDDDDKTSLDLPRRTTVKGAKAAKILGLASIDQAESPSGVTLPDASPTETHGKDLPVKMKMKIQRKPLPSAPPAPARKRTMTDSSPECEVRTPRASQEEEEEQGLVPKGLRIGGRKERGVKEVEVEVAVVNTDDDILDYYSR